MSAGWGASGQDLGVGRLLGSGLAVVGILGCYVLNSGCTRSDQDSSMERDCAVLKLALFDYAVHYDWVSLVALAERLEHEGEDANAVLMDIMLGNPRGTALDSLNPDREAFISPEEVRVAPTGSLTDGRGRPYGICMRVSKDKNGQGSAVEIRVWSIGPNAVDEGGTGDDGTWAATIREH